MTLSQPLLLFFIIIIIFNMNASNNADDSMNFSVIDKNESHQGHLDFSVQQLLENNENAALTIKQEPPDPQTARQNVFNKIKQIHQNTTKSIIRPSQPHPQDCSQQFLKDLSRMEKELSFEVQSYNIYEDPPNNSIEVIPSNKSKTLSYLKVTKEFTNKSISNENLQDFNDYYGDLIIDFHIKDGKHKIIAKNDSKNASKNISNEHSNQSLTKRLKNSISKKDMNNFYRLKDVRSSSKNKLHVKPRKSKSKSLTHKIGLTSAKSQSHLRTSTEGETFEQKVFTEYYGTQVNFNPPKKEIRKKREGNSDIVKSKEKCSKSKLGLLSPKPKQVQRVHAKK